MSLTHKGQLFLRHAHRILETVADARRSLADEGPASAGELHVGVTSLVAGYVFSDLLARYRRANPGSRSRRSRTIATISSISSSTANSTSR